MVLRETSSAPVYVMCGGTLVHIPTSDALVHLGYSWGDVQVVPDGSLAGLPKVDPPSLGATPPSMVFPMNKYKDDGVPSPLTKWCARPEVPGITLPNGNHVAEIRGVFADWSNEINLTDPDISWTLIPSACNLDRPGVDPTRFFRVGDILHSNRSPVWNGTTPSDPDRHAWVATPIFHLELSGWPANNIGTTGSMPADWHPLAAFAPSWAYDVNALELLNGKEVVVSGSVVTDEPHTPKVPSGGYGNPAADWQGSVGQYAENNPPRWTEIHSPDSIAPDPSSQGTDSLIGVAVVARTSGVDPFPKSQNLDVTITCPVPPPSPTSGLVVREYVLPDTYLPSIVGGNANLNGADFAVLPNTASFHLHVEVQGAAFQGSAGRFAAIYRMSWVEKGKEKPEKEKEKEKEHGKEATLSTHAEKTTDHHAASPGASQSAPTRNEPASEETEDPRTGSGTARVFIRHSQRP